MVHESEKCTTKWGKMGRKNLDFDPFFEVVVQFWYTNRNLWYTFFQGVPRAKLTYFITLIASFLDMASVPTIRVIFDRRKTATAVKKASVEIEVYYNRERTRVSTGVSVPKHIRLKRLKRQTYETYLHIITSHLVSVKIW